jgi:hypothetical protein
MAFYLQYISLLMLYWLRVPYIYYFIIFLFSLDWTVQEQQCRVETEVHFNNVRVHNNSDFDFETSLCQFRSRSLRYLINVRNCWYIYITLSLSYTVSVTCLSVLNPCGESYFTWENLLRFRKSSNYFSTLHQERQAGTRHPSWQSIFLLRIRIRIGSGFNRVYRSRSRFAIWIRIKESKNKNRKKNSFFEVLDVLLWGLKASHEARTSFKKA